MFGHRSFLMFLNSMLSKQHYIALLNMWRVYPQFFDNLRRYILCDGEYPYNIKINTKNGLLEVILHSYHDLMTVNEIFCRLDYRANSKINTVVDFGSNIGVSALYFLSQNEKSRCYLFEPDPKNIERLKKTLFGFEQRYELNEVAVSNESGIIKFGVEVTGRYGGINIDSEKYIEVQCLDVNKVLQDILSRENLIDILKIDTEGVEIQTVESIKIDFLKRIKVIYLEAFPMNTLHQDIFVQEQYGSICQLTNREYLHLRRSPSKRHSLQEN
jgi:FkbM family methyltransferase